MDFTNTLENKESFHEPIALPDMNSSPLTSNPEMDISKRIDCDEFFKPEFSFTDYYFLTNEYNLLEIGITFLMISLFIKLALAPAHVWSLDVYEGSPSSSTFFFSVISKVGAFVLLTRLCVFNLYSLNTMWVHSTNVISLLSVFIGSFGGLKQRRLKTLLSYSSTSNMGYLLLGFNSNIVEGVKIIMFYLINYMVSGTCFWAIFLLTHLKKKKKSNKFSKELGDLSALKKSNSVLAFSLTLIVFSMAGIPPMGGFLAKMSIFMLALAKPSFGAVSTIALAFSVASTFYYIRIVKVMYFENSITGKLYYPASSQTSIALSFFILLPLFIFIQPNCFFLTCEVILLYHR